MAKLAQLYADLVNNAAGRSAATVDTRDQQYRWRDAINKVIGGQSLDSNAPPIGNVIDEARLIPYRTKLEEGMSPDQARVIPQATFVPGRYGDMAQILVTLAANVDLLALSRPKNTRILLIVYNSAAANLFIAFDQAANAGSLPIPPGGNLFLDNAVPQNDIHLFYAAGATTVPIYYINTDISSQAR